MIALRFSRDESLVLSSSIISLSLFKNKIETIKVNATTNGTAPVTYEITGTLVNTKIPNVTKPALNAIKAVAMPRDNLYLSEK